MLESTSLFQHKINSTLTYTKFLTICVYYKWLSWHILLSYKYPIEQLYIAGKALAQIAQNVKEHLFNTTIQRVKLCIEQPINTINDSMLWNIYVNLYLLHVLGKVQKMVEFSSMTDRQHNICGREFKSSCYGSPPTLGPSNCQQLSSGPKPSSLQPFTN